MSKINQKAAELLKNSKNAGTEAVANATNNTATENADSKAKAKAKAKAEKPTTYTPDFICRALEGKNTSPFLAKLNLNLATLKKEFASFKSEFCDKFTQTEPPASITAIHALEKWQELETQRKFAEFLIKNLAKYITPSNPNSKFARTELNAYEDFILAKRNNIAENPEAIGAYEALYGTKKETLKSENERLKAEIALLKAKAGLETA